jgi:DNA-binding GntR family transcriptional regulator
MVMRQVTSQVIPELSNVVFQSGASSDGQRVAFILREAIRRGLLRPGTRLVQRDLAASLSVSRIPVRDALQTLLAEGLVTSAGGGLLVTELTPEDVEELYSLRLLIEPELAPWITSNITEQARGLLMTLVAEMDAQFEASDQVGWSQSNFTFHSVLYTSARRPTFARMAHQLLTLVESYSRMSTMYLGGWKLSQEEHRTMVDAINRADSETLRGTLEIHLKRAQGDLVAFTSELERARVRQPALEETRLALSDLDTAVQRFVDAYNSGGQTGGSGSA